MKIVKNTFLLPEHQLACDDVLLDLAEAGSIGSCLRLWEPLDYFVVLGRGNSYTTEVNVSACHAEGIPIFRRQSGGGTIIQGPGCVNYMLVLDMEMDPALKTISGTNAYVMARMVEMLRPLFPEIGAKGHTDLALGDFKVVGNAQRRKRRFLLFHGCILVGLDFSKVTQYLAHPSLEPDYRKGRSHSEFLTHLPTTYDTLEAVFQRYWGVDGDITIPLKDLVDDYAKQFYLNEDWNLSR